MQSNYAGVDTHRDLHSIVIVDHVGHILKSFVIAATMEGYQQAIADAAAFDDVIWGIEGTGSYGRGFADFLLASSAIVYEVLVRFTMIARGAKEKHIVARYAH